MGPTSQSTRQAVHPFCGPCTNETIEWPAPDTSTYSGVGAILYGAAAPCPRCGSVVKQLFFCLLWIPVWPMGRYRVITFSTSLTGSRSTYVGRRFPVRPDNPYGFNKKTVALLAQAEAEREKAERSRPTPPPSRLADHPELRDRRYRQAQTYWTSGSAHRALPIYEELLAAHEAVLPADDTATLQLRQRVAEAHLAAGSVTTALALLAQTTAHLVRVLGSYHPDTRRALDDLSTARRQLGLSRDEAEALDAALDELESTVGLDHPDSLRMACALASAREIHAVLPALDLLRATLDRSERALGADHPDTGYVRSLLLNACDYAEYRGKPAEVRAAVLAREQVHGPDAPETLAAMRRLAELYASSRRHRKEAVRLLRDILTRCCPDDPLTADVRRRLHELS